VIWGQEKVKILERNRRRNEEESSETGEMTREEF
jgi:hypothetical protein